MFKSFKKYLSFLKNKNFQAQKILPYNSKLLSHSTNPLLQLYSFLLFHYSFTIRLFLDYDSFEFNIKMIELKNNFKKI